MADIDIFLRQIRSRSIEHQHAMRLLAEVGLAGQMTAVGWQGLLVPGPFDAGRRQHSGNRQGVDAKSCRQGLKTVTYPFLAARPDHAEVAAGGR